MRRAGVWANAAGSHGGMIMIDEAKDLPIMPQNADLLHRPAEEGAATQPRAEGGEGAAIAGTDASSAGAVSSSAGLSASLSGPSEPPYEGAAAEASGDDVGGVLSPEEVEPLPEGTGRPIELIEQPEGEQPVEMEWYIVKVQSNREDSVRSALERKVKRDGKEHLFGEIIVPEEKVTEFKNQRKRVVRRKLYPGYIVLQMVRSGSEAHEDAQMLVRSVPGIGDFVGSKGKGNVVVPTPLSPQEVDRIVARREEKADETPRLKISFKTGDRVKITEGTFENFEGDVGHIDEANGRVTVMINIFGRSTPVELEYWQIESV